MRHIRGNEELHPLVSDVNYDYTYQEYHQLHKPRKIYKVIIIIINTIHIQKRGENLFSIPNSVSFDQLKFNISFIHTLERILIFPQNQRFFIFNKNLCDSSKCSTRKKIFLKKNRFLGALLLVPVTQFFLLLPFS